MKIDRFEWLYSLIGSSFGTFICKFYLHFYFDHQLVENVAICIIKIAERVGQSPEMLDELCRHGVIHQVMHLINLNGRTSTSPEVCNVCFLILLFKNTCITFLSVYSYDMWSKLNL